MRTPRPEPAGWVSWILCGKLQIHHPQAVGLLQPRRGLYASREFTTAREAVEAHSGEALTSRKAFDGLSPGQQNDLIEFLKSLQVLPPGSKSLVVDEHGNPKEWPPSADSSEGER